MKYKKDDGRPTVFDNVIDQDEAAFIRSLITLTNCKSKIAIKKII